MTAEIKATVTELVKATNALDDVRTGDLVSELTAAFARGRGLDIQADAMRAFKALRRKRMFPHLQRAVESYLAQVSDAPIVHTLYAQALIDQNQLAGGLGIVQEVQRRCPPDTRAAEEARGLLGRIYKQAFVRPSPGLPRGSDALALSIDAYASAYQAAKLDALWPGVNLVALLMRARQDGVEVKAPLSPEALAQRLLNEVAAKERLEDAAANAQERAPRDEPWLMATALESHLALGDDAHVMAYAERYLTARDTDAFELGATVRQLKEIWRLHERRELDMPQLLGLLEAELLAKKGGILADPSQVAGLPEAIYGSERFQPLKWLANAQKAADGVGRVEDINGRPVGTGFLVRGRDLRSSWGEAQVFVTNRHVIDDPAPEKGVTPQRAVVRFTSHEGSDGSDGVRVGKILWRSAPEPGLDVTVVSLERKVARDWVLDLDCTGVVQVGTPPPRIYVIGHPQGESLSYSLYDNELVNVQAPFLYYRSPTLNGSSGSPLFNHDWSVIGIHHHGSNPVWKANGGSLIAALHAAMEAQ